MIRKDTKLSNFLFWIVLSIGCLFIISYVMVGVYLGKEVLRSLTYDCLS